MDKFDDFWSDKRIPREMKRCGKPPVRKALVNFKGDLEEILTSLPHYEADTDGRYLCHLSTYINQERHEIWNDPEQHAPSGPRDWWEAREEEQRIKEKMNATNLKVVK